MLNKQHNISYNWRITTTTLVVVMLLLFVSCKDKNDNIVAFKYDPEVVPTLITESFTTLISDSGVTQYKLVADKWMVFDKAKEPFQFFPSGLYFERFTPDFEIEATVVADTAWYYTEKELWKLKSNVHVENMQGEEFESEELFWDGKNGRVYSDKYIEIKRGDTRIKGYGFESDETMTNYRIFRPHDGLLPFKDENTTDSIAVDTTDNNELGTRHPVPPSSSVLSNSIQIMNN
ncbi:MAG: LPS export ABC transporter periplasmic protein LptC [Fermentimonas sp.]|nr:LPS export ABC transporter periplasmic protein LptC [Fermentimonas sp.]